MDKVYDVCMGNLECNPELVKYPSIIEKSISLLLPKLEPVIKSHKYLHRWISLKLIDDNKEIIRSVEKHLRVDLMNNNEIKNELIHIQDLLLEQGIIKNNLKDKIVSSIMFRAEDICNDVILYKRADYNNIDRKIDKILTSKIYGFPIMILFLGSLFWITIIAANYPSKILFSFFNFLEGKLLMFLEFLHSPSLLSSILISRNI